MKTLNIFIILSFIVISAFSQEIEGVSNSMIVHLVLPDIEGLSNSQYVYLIHQDTLIIPPPVDPCKNENLQIQVSSYLSSTYSNEIIISGSINGVKQAIATTTINDIVVARNNTTFSKNYPLEIGLNTLEITTNSTCGNTVSKTISITRKIKRTDYALIFVIDNPTLNNFTQIPNAQNDANNLRNVLVNDYGFEAKMIDNPTIDEFNNIINEYASKTYNNNDQLLVYLVGHGDIDKIGNAITEYYFVFEDNRLTQHAFTNAINAIPVKHILFIANTCYSGASVTQSGFKPFVEETLSLDEKIDDYLQDKITRKIIAAGKDLVPSGYDSSPLISKILNYLQSNTNEIITFQNLAIKATDFKYTSGSKPIYGHFGTDELSTTFIFIPKNLY